MMNECGEFCFRVRTYECGPDGAATLPSVCNYLQEAASRHAAELGFSKADLAAAGADASWVLTRLRVRLAQFPRWDETVVVETWPRGGRRIVAYRDFVLRVGGEVIGEATSEWMVIDLRTRKVLPVPTAAERLAGARPPVLGESPFARLRWSEGGCADALPFRARRGDIDLNGHVNNVHVIEWLVEAVPDGMGPVAEFEVVFRAETRAGEEVLAASVAVEDGTHLAHIASADGVERAIARFRFAWGFPSNEIYTLKI